MGSYLKAFIDPDNTIPIFLAGNIGAIIGALASHFADLPAWIALPGCFGLILLSPIVTSAVRRAIAEIDRGGNDLVFRAIIQSLSSVVASFRTWFAHFP